MFLFPVDEIPVASPKPIAPNCRNTPDEILIEWAMRKPVSISSEPAERNLSSVEEHGGTKYVVLRCGGGVLEVYAVHQTRMQRVPRHKWPAVYVPFQPEKSFRASNLSEQELVQRAIQFLGEKAASAVSAYSGLKMYSGQRYLVLRSASEFVAAFWINGEYFNPASWVDECMMVIEDERTSGIH